MMSALPSGAPGPHARERERALERARERRRCITHTAATRRASLALGKVIMSVQAGIRGVEGERCGFNDKGFSRLGMVHGHKWKE